MIKIQTRMTPDAMLAACHEIEARLGRDRMREVRWGPRTIDIDLIAFGDIMRDGPHLHLPHPRFAERAFVIVPLHELAPDLTIGGHSVAMLFNTLDRSGVQKIT